MTFMVVRGFSIPNHCIEGGGPWLYIRCTCRISTTYPEKLRRLVFGKFEVSFLRSKTKVSKSGHL